MEGLEHEELDVLQADLDDESPQVLAAACERALALGALDAHLCPLLMKKGRPGTRVELLVRPAERERFVRFLLEHTATLGVKARRVDRYALPRRIESVDVRGYAVRVKLALGGDGEVLRAQPEFDDVRLLAEGAGLPVREAMELVRAAYRERGSIP